MAVDITCFMHHDSSVRVLLKPWIRVATL